MCTTLNYGAATCIAWCIVKGPNKGPKYDTAIKALDAWLDKCTKETYAKAAEHCPSTLTCDQLYKLLKVGWMEPLRKLWIFPNNGRSDIATVLEQYLLNPTTEYQDYASIFAHDEPAPIKGTHDLCAGGLCDHGLRLGVDKDDTTRCSGGPPLGVHKDCLKGAIYPGAHMAIKALAQSHSTDGVGRHGGFFKQISARPSGEIVKFGGQRRSYLGDDVFPGTALDDLLDHIGYGGRDPEGLIAMASGDWTAVGYTKVINFRMSEKDAQYAHVDDGDNDARKEEFIPTAAVFIGDNGEGDAYAGREMQHDVRVSFIHKVAPSPDNMPSHGDVKALKEDSSGLVYFYSYPELGKHALALNLITKESYRAILHATLRSAIAHACCNEKVCDQDSEQNRRDGTCGRWSGGKEDEWGEASQEVLSYEKKEGKKDPCRDIRDAVDLAREEQLAFTCKFVGANHAAGSSTNLFLRVVVISIFFLHW